MNRKLMGFTLIEVVAVLVVLGMISLYAIPRVGEEWSERIVNHAASRVHDVFTAARRYRLDTQNWPSSPAALVSAGYLTTGMAAAPLGGSYTFNIITTPAGEHFELQFNAGQSIYANRLLARLPNSRRIGVADVASAVPIPGHEPSYDALDEKYYHRDGSKNLTGPLAGGDQDALDLNAIYANLIIDREDITKVLNPAGLSVINNLDANTVDANRVETDVLKMTQVRRSGDPCSNAVGDIGVTSSGDLVTCKDGSWTAQKKLTFRSASDSIFGLATVSNRFRFDSGTYQLPSWIVDENPVALVVTALCEVSGGNWGGHASSRIRFAGKTIADTYDIDGAHNEINSMTIDAGGRFYSWSVNGCNDSAGARIDGFWY